MAQISDLIGERIVRVSGYGEGCEEITFTTASCKTFRMYHQQDCCERVIVDDIAGGELQDLVGEVVENAYESSSADLHTSESGTWTFYWIATNKVTLVIRWYGESNGYYGEGVEFDLVGAAT